MVSICESLFVLTMDEEGGDVDQSLYGNFESILAGAVLTDLVLHHRLAVENSRIIVVDQNPTQHAVLDKALLEIIGTARSRKIRYWINTLVYYDVMGEIGRYLVAQGTFVRKKKHLYLADPTSKPMSMDLSAKDILKSELYDVVMVGREADLPEKVLLAFIYYSDWLKQIFHHGARKPAKKRISKLIIREDGESNLGEGLYQIVGQSTGIIG